MKSHYYEQSRFWYYSASEAHNYRLTSIETLNYKGSQLGLPDSEVENNGDLKKMVIFMQNGIGNIVK